MDEDKQLIETAKALGLSEIAPEVYRDMLQPAVREVGNGLLTVAKAVSISLAPLEVGVWGYGKIKNWLSLRVTRLLADRKVVNVITPKLSIAGPIVTQMIFAQNEPELKEMYASLLASSMDSNSSVHPSFVSIIQQLTSDEAKILKYLNSLERSKLYLIEDSSISKESINTQFQQWCLSARIDNIHNSDSYMDNLIRLRILNQIYGSDTEYIPEGGDRYGTYEASVESKEFVEIELTIFGEQFISACIENK